MNLTLEKRKLLKEAIKRAYGQFSYDKVKNDLTLLELLKNHISNEQFMVDFLKIMKGSIITYINEEVIKEIESWKIGET